MQLHGRDEDLRAIDEALASGRSVAIRGVAGIGKTSLWRAALVALARRDVPIRRVVATATTRMIPGGALAGLVAASPEPPGAGDRLVATLRALQGTVPPVLLAIDDAQLLDDESAAAVLAHVLAGGQALLTARREEPAPDAVARLWKDGLAAVVDLGPLAPGASAALVAEQVAAPVDARTQARLHEASGGSPLVLRELVAHGLASGALADLGGVRVWVGELDPGPNVAAVIRERIAGVDPAARAVAELLAVSGPLPPALLERLEPALALQTARRVGLLRDRVHGADRVVDLAHPLYGPVLTETLSVARTRVLLERLVTELEPLAAQDGALGVLLAACLLRLADRSRPELLAAAADRAFRRAELPLAERLVRAALDAGAGAPAERLAARLDAFRGGASSAPARPPRGDLAVFEAAMACADAFLVGVGTREAALAELARAQARLAGALRHEAAAHALTIRVHAGDPTGALLHDARRLLAGEPPPAARARIALACGPALAVAGRPLDAIEELTRGIAAAAEPADFSPYLLERLHSTRVQCQLLAGRIEEAFAMAGARHAAAEAAADGPALAVWSQVLGWILLWRGRPREAAGHLAASLALAGNLDVVGYATWCQADLAWSLAWTSGPAPDGNARAPHAPEPGSHGALLAPLVHLSLASRCLCRGDPVEARAQAERAVERAAEGEQPLLELLAEHLLVRLRASGPRAARIEALAARCQGDLAAALAASSAALAGGRAAPLESAAERLAGIGLAPLAAEWFLHAGAAHREAGSTVASRRCGNRARQERTRMEAEPPLPAAAAALDPLTPRERQIASLAAAGRTNQDIARQLAVSVRTVHAHLRTIYDKLGVNERQLLGGLLHARRSDA